MKEQTKQKINNFLAKLSKSKTLRIISYVANFTVFFTLILSGYFILKYVNVMLGSIVLLMVAIYLVLQKIDWG
jgi:hypothetical protein